LAVFHVGHALKQMFDAFINRLLAYSLQTHIGLMTFGIKASVSQGITDAVENFRHNLNNMAAAGDTAIWDNMLLYIRVKISDY
jgi:NADH:ubiquinone oxidoreductase subunit 4 (subunit M)